MRIRSQKQLYFKPQSPRYSTMETLAEMANVLVSLAEYEEILDRISADLNPSNSTSNAGRKGMTVEQVLRALILKNFKQCSYRELSELTFDSNSAREFLGIGPIEWGESGFNYKTLQRNIKLLREETIDFINAALNKHALSQEIESGDKTRTDATAIESNIHYPTDWSLMDDCNRVLSRCMTFLFEDFQAPIDFCNHYRGSKSRLYEINNCGPSKKRRRSIIKLIRLTKKTLKYAKDAVPVLEAYKSQVSLEDLPTYIKYLNELRRVIPLAERIIDVAYRRVVKGESVDSSEKIFSIFESHTDIISKGQRDVTFGHKVTLTTGSSGLVLDVMVHEGNPCDSTVVAEVVKNHVLNYQKAPEEMVFDGCYGSEENRNLLIESGVEAFTFCKEKTTTLSKPVIKALRFFRAGIEGIISILKRMFGWKRVMERGMQSFRKEVKASVTAYNLFILARHNLARAKS